MKKIIILLIAIMLLSISAAAFFDKEFTTHYYIIRANQTLLLNYSYTCPINTAITQLNNSANGSVVCNDYWLDSTGDTGTGNYTFDSPTFHVDSNTDRVGIGTTTPAYSLDVNGQLRATVLRLTSGYIDSGNFLCPYAGAGYYRIYTQNQPLTFWTDGFSEAMRITNTGNVGIGTTTPTVKLQISVADDADGIQIVDSGDSDNQRALMGRSDAGGGFLQLTADDESNPVLIRSYSVNDVGAYFNSGNVGIGTTTPVAKVQVEGSSSETDSDAFANDVSYNVVNNDNTTDNFAQQRFQSIDHNGDIFSYTGITGVFTDKTPNSIDGEMLFHTRFNDVWGQRMKINNNGFLEVDSMESRIAYFDNNMTDYSRIIVDGDTNADTQISFMNDGATKWSVGNDAGTDSLIFRTGFGKFGTNDIVTIESSGDVGIGTTAPYAKLHIKPDSPDAFRLYDDETDHYFSMTVSNSGKTIWDTTGNTIRLYDGTNAFSFDIYNGNTKRIDLQSNGTTYFNGGNVGIGTTTPDQKLKVDGNINVTGNIYAGGCIQYNCTQAGGCVTLGTCI